MALVSIFYVAVGGMYTFSGPIVGAVVLTLLPEIFRFAADYRMILYGVVVIIVVIIFPRGIVDEILYKIEKRSSKRNKPPNSEGDLKNDWSQDESKK